MAGEANCMAKFEARWGSVWKCPACSRTCQTKYEQVRWMEAQLQHADKVRAVQPDYVPSCKTCRKMPARPKIHPVPPTRPSSDAQEEPALLEEESELAEFDGEALLHFWLAAGEDAILLVVYGAYADILRTHTAHVLQGGGAAPRALFCDPAGAVCFYFGALSDADKEATVQQKNERQTLACRYNASTDLFVEELVGLAYF